MYSKDTLFVLNSVFKKFLIKHSCTLHPRYNARFGVHPEIRVISDTRYNEIHVIWMLVYFYIFIFQLLNYINYDIFYFPAWNSWLTLREMLNFNTQNSHEIFTLLYNFSICNIHVTFTTWFAVLFHTSLENLIIIIITCYLSTPFIILQIHKGASRVIFTNFLKVHPLTWPHPHAVGRKVIIISNCWLVPYWRESAGLKLSRTFLLQTHID